jgi:hypothetical protein
MTGFPNRPEAGVRFHEFSQRLGDLGIYANTKADLQLRNSINLQIDAIIPHRSCGQLQTFRRRFMLGSLLESPFSMKSIIEGYWRGTISDG